jgi:hypothetical protein
VPDQKHLSLPDARARLKQLAEAYGWPWPMEKEEILERLVALHDERVAEEQRGLVPVSVDDATASFTGAKREHLERHFETLALMGEVTLDADGRYQAARKVA